MKQAFTLIELLVSMTLIALLALVSSAVLSSVKGSAYNARCVAGLSQLGLATQLYLNDHNNRYFPFVENTAEGKIWYFGLETGAENEEGKRHLDATSGPLYPYIQSIGLIEHCPCFNYRSANWKPKFEGASWGYGYNWVLGGGASGKNRIHRSAIAHPGSVVVFGDCAQINTFQSPASPDNPMLEEFYIINERDRTIHFRHQSRANFLFADGHVDSLPLEPGTEDSRIKGETLGRIAPAGSFKYLR
ncbi:MAG: prepilin-type N-terminal cleavage/methylation domain-containing protein [Verrucomicrobiaceae bacterium]|nr:prepilin-type N-terminal cleavage/methylation domain-containing protein [Verrucomicrobiaceae bacterium]